MATLSRAALTLTCITFVTVYGGVAATVAFGEERSGGVAATVAWAEEYAGGSAATTVWTVKQSGGNANNNH